MRYDIHVSRREPAEYEKTLDDASEGRGPHFGWARTLDGACRRGTKLT